MYQITITDNSINSEVFIVRNIASLSAAGAIVQYFLDECNNFLPLDGYDIKIRKWKPEHREQCRDYPAYSVFLKNEVNDMRAAAEMIKQLREQERKLDIEIGSPKKHYPSIER